MLFLGGFGGGRGNGGRGRRLCMNLPKLVLENSFLWSFQGEGLVPRVKAPRAICRPRESKTRISSKAHDTRFMDRE